jgi:hypothetical protein
MKLRARAFGVIWCVAAVAVACAANEVGNEVGTAAQAETTAERPRGEQDVPLPGSTPYTDAILGPRVAGPPLDPEYLARQQRYFDLLVEQLRGWEAAGLPPEQIEANQAALKREILGED